MLQSIFNFDNCMFGGLGCLAFIYIITVIVFVKKSKGLKFKLSGMIETLAAKNKELEELRISNQNILSPFIPETSKSIIISIDQGERITSANDYALEIFGFSKDDLIGKKAFDTIFPMPEKKDSLQANIISRIFKNPKLYVEHETENIKKSGEHFWISWTNRVIYDDAGDPLEIRSVGFDITKRKRLEEELRFLGSVDPLTGVLNRQALLEAGARELKRAKRYKRDMAVLVLKLNYFHDINDSTGFSDDILQQAVSICRQATRDSDYIGRVGDVEFAIILPETSPENALILAQRLKDKIQEKGMSANKQFFVSATFGVSDTPTETDTIDSLLLKALQTIQKPVDKKNVSHPKRKGNLS